MSRSNTPPISGSLSALSDQGSFSSSVSPRSLFLLAFDHRASFTRDVFGLQNARSSSEAAAVSDAKMLVFEGFQRALDRGAPTDVGGVLVDEEFGTEVARRAISAGVTLAMPVEQSGRKAFEFAYGEEFGAHIERFDPTFAKVLVRYNPDDSDGNTEQTRRLRRLSDWLRAHGRQFLFELLVPATEAQLASVGNDPDTYDRDLRPGLVVRAIAELQEAGVEPEIWKIEGLETPEDCARVVGQARAGGRDAVRCIVLGRGASGARVEHWLRTAATVDGFDGFAVGRTIWMDPLVAYRGGSINRDEAADHIADRYLRMIEIYTTAAHETRTRGTT